MPGVRKLRKIQFGLEVATARGGAVVATKLWRGSGVIDDQREIVFPEEDIGLLSGADRTYIPKLAAQIALDDTPLTFEQLPLLLCIGIDDVISGAADGTGTDFIHTFVAPTTVDPGFKTFTVEGGDDQQAEEMEYAIATEITLKGAVGESWMMAGTILGRQVTDADFTASVAVPAVEEALFSKTKLYIDDGGGTIGTTLISNALLDAEISITTGLMPVFTADGELYFSFVKRVAPEITLALTFEHTSDAVLEKADWRAQTTRLVRLVCLGSAFATPGTAHTYHTLQIDGAGRWETFDALDEVEGNDVIRASLRYRYSSTDALFFEIVVANEVQDTIAE